MKQGLILLLAACTLAAAMVPRVRREREKMPQTSTRNSLENKMDTCARRTPCKWVVYDQTTKKNVTTLMNTYCVCSEEQQCTYGEDDESANAYIYYCRDQKHRKTSGTGAR